MAFCTAINCMDGRVQLPVINYLKNYFDVKYVDSITAAGPNRILAAGENTAVIQSMLRRLSISLEKHDSNGIAVIGHHDCAGNPVPKDEQVKHIKKAINFLKQQHPATEIIGLWVDQDWQVHNLDV